ncbi:MULTISPECIES: hypothetical protein [Methylobacterium]|uniref:hypothetical protein n=1 Tax=Methylobacterium TaxID=407 RepID=UPI0019D2023D|nr:hypothetical protein [Methylobacterium sp. DB0501]
MVRIGSATLIRADALDVPAALAEAAPGTLGAVLCDPPYSSGGTTAGERARPPSQKHQQSEHRHLHRDFARRHARPAQLPCLVGPVDGPGPRGGGAGRAVRRLLRLAPAAGHHRFRPGGGLGLAGYRALGQDPGGAAGARPLPGQDEYVVWGSNGPRPMAGATAPGCFSVPVPRAKLHMAAKPVALMDGLLSIMDGPILGPFMDSGTIPVTSTSPAGGWRR